MEIIVVRGGGDIASGVIQKLYRTGFNVVITEIEKPNFIRRDVCFGQAIYDKEKTLEGITSIFCKNENEVISALNSNKIPVIVDSKLEKIESFKNLKLTAVIDAIISKKEKNLKDKYPITIGLGPGFEAGKSVDLVIETMRGHNLGRIIFEGSALPNTGIPGTIKGVAEERVIYSQDSGYLTIIKDIGTFVKKNEIIATIDGKNVYSTIDGIIRGMINNQYYVKEGLKIADIDPRTEELENCFTISDKARAIGGSALEALLILKNRINN
ncbi:EF2563 family selenium-dependent molybdenum hydroxylase system protein [Cetobacterium sp. 2A]|uniref:selenium-dependent molybdenum cofactor biosynthesis protein YqeB n=1 Tax=Cetobacterium sp. 2A TaxID=2754723 RepID=UPI00163C1860|nr:selenium-dependent molybdenum cofactor biosynthesis protein YqeB [Cetobacterium sp. 2A]MBC2855180.1 EF2563 family selenium-dependent molybdenum hydroxylase system protein [Cetobacterium sp. 2A]